MSKNRPDEIKALKQAILTIGIPDKERLVDRLIELEGMGAMQFFQELFRVDPYQQHENSKELNNSAGYGVRQLIKLAATQSLSAFKFCPCCKTDLIEYELIDPYKMGLKCRNEHHFHIDIENEKSNNVDIKSDKNSLLELAGEWLTDKDLRNNLQSQLAEILRKYIDLKTQNTVVEQKISAFKYCPLCSSRLKKFKQDDIWVVGLKCKNGHELYLRNGLSYEGAQLEPDLSNENFIFLLNAYVDDPGSRVPNQIIKLLSDIKKEMQ